MAAKIPPKVGKIVDVFVSLAAAVVIYGALQKILHTPLADIMLKVGLTVEALIFLSYGLLYIYYPAMDDHEMHIPDITPANLGKLSTGFQKLSTTVGQMTDIGDVVKSTGDFSAKTKEAATAVGNVAGAVNVATSSLGSFNEASASTKKFHEQVQVLTKNLGSLNTIYELELQESNNHLKALNQFYGKLAQASTAMASSADDAVKAKEQIATLATNLGKLNQVYGNMLTAMSGRQ